MLFIALMFITTSCVAGAAAFFSVYGLAHTFAASFWSVVFMGGSLEAGKLMLASYLYRFKDAVTWRTKSLGYAFVLVLMLITSLGIYGYLADAYQSGSTDMKQVNASLNLKKEEQANLQKRKAEIDAQIAQVPTKDVRGKQRLMKQFGPEVDTINTRLIALTTEVQQEAQKQITTDSHVGPIVFVAKTIGMEPDNAISLLILMIVFAFDPLAIYLTIATNTALEKYNTKKVKEDEPRGEMHQDIWLPNPGPTDTVVEEGAHDGEYSRSEELAAEMLATADQDAAEQDHQDLIAELFTPEELAKIEAELMAEPPTDFPEIEEDLPSVALVDEPAPLKLVSPGVPLYVGDDTYYPPPVVREPVADMAALGNLFSKEETEDVAAEEGTEAPPVQQLAKIYEEVASKDVTEQTPMDVETMNRIERFFKRQELIKNVRTGDVE